MTYLAESEGTAEAILDGFCLIVSGSSGRSQPPTRENDHRSSDRYRSGPGGNVPSAALMSIPPGVRSDSVLGVMPMEAIEKS